jgi:phage terminase large subunit GpA-like protein
MKKRMYEVFSSALNNVRPPKKITVSEWADENRVLSSGSSAEPGRWNTDRIPYQREIMDAVNDPKCEKVVVCSSAQIGKSEIINNIMGYYIDVDPCPMILVQPTIQTAMEYSKQRIAPMITSTKVLRDKVLETKTRDSDNTILMKTFDGGFLTIGGANSPAGLASKPIRIVFCDEVDRFPDSAGTEGDPIKLVEKRATTFANRKLIYTSTPTIKGASRIEFEYEKGSRENWAHECPHCGGYFSIRLEDLRFDYEKEEYNGKKLYTVSDVKWRCPACMEEFDEYTIKRQPAQWQAEKPENKRVRSFHINAFYSVFTRWNDLVREYLDSKDDPEMFKTFYNTVLGESFEDRGEIEDETFLLRRQEEYEEELPEGVLFLTCGIDTQDDRLEYEVAGWGHGRGFEQRGNGLRTIFASLFMRRGSMRQLRQVGFRRLDF